MERVCILQARDSIVTVSLFLLKFEICIVERGTIKLPESNGGNIWNFIRVKGHSPIQRPCKNQVSYIFATGYRPLYLNQYLVRMRRMLQLGWVRDDSRTTYR